jgi:hypothetical protein
MKSLVFTLIIFGFLATGCKNSPETTEAETLTEPVTIDSAEQAVINQLDSVSDELELQQQEIETKKEDLEKALNDLPE